jgi:zinc protease
MGSLDDLQAATLADVKEFHGRWYGPNNASLVVAGDIDVGETKAWIEKYFGEIPSREMPAVPEPPAVSLTQPRRLFHEDNFARLPQLSIVWPTVPHYHPDSYALDLLAGLLTDGKMTPFYKVIVKEDMLAPETSAFHWTQELAGRFDLDIRAYPDTDLDAVYAAVEKAFMRFEETGVPADELRRVKAGYETSFYSRLSSTLGKALRLAQHSWRSPRRTCFGCTRRTSRASRTWRRASSRRVSWNSCWKVPSGLRSSKSRSSRVRASSNSRDAEKCRRRCPPSTVRSSRRWAIRHR